MVELEFGSCYRKFLWSSYTSSSGNGFHYLYLHVRLVFFDAIVADHGFRGPDGRNHHTGVALFVGHRKPERYGKQRRSNIDVVRSIHGRKFSGYGHLLQYP